MGSFTGVASYNMHRNMVQWGERNQKGYKYAMESSPMCDLLDVLKGVVHLVGRNFWTIIQFGDGGRNHFLHIFLRVHMNFLLVAKGQGLHKTKVHALPSPLALPPPHTTHERLTPMKQIIYKL